MGLDPIKNHLFYVMSYSSIYSFLTDTSVTLDLFPLSMSLFAQDYHVSQSLFSVSQWLVLLNCWDYLARIWCLLGQFFPRRDNSSHAFIGRLVYPCFCSDKCIFNAQHQPYVFSTNDCGDDRRLPCGIRFKAFNSCTGICSASINTAGRPHFQVPWPAFVLCSSTEYQLPIYNKSLFHILWSINVLCVI